MSNKKKRGESIKRESSSQFEKANGLSDRRYSGSREEFDDDDSDDLFEDESDTQSEQDEEPSNHPSLYTDGRKGPPENDVVPPQKRGTRLTNVEGRHQRH